MRNIKGAWILAGLGLLACSTGNRKPESGAPPTPTQQQQPTSGPSGNTGNSTAVPDTAGAGGGAAPAGVTCGPKTCAVGQICCNESCGICTPPDGVCTQQMCAPGQTGMMGMGTPGAGTGACQKDADCRIFSDYCTGCDCRALGKDDRDPACSGPGVRCLADPCRDKVAVCKDGSCKLADKR